MIFDFPPFRAHRRHGPRGYAGYDSYRPWLRDEFTFRCVYCLKRERWGQVTGEFDIDHFQPQVRSPQLSVDYENLLYSCRRCNGVKLDHEVADPIPILSAGRVRALPDGRVESTEEAAQRLILQLDLNSPRMVEWRILWMRIADLAERQDRDLWRRIVGFPNELPDLRRMRPPAGNGRPEGIVESWAVQSERGKLPEFY